MRDHYITLQVDPGADPEVIEAAYRRLARKWHPDKNPDPHAAVRMKELNEAYEVLRDPTRRRGYDAARATSKRPTTEARSSPVPPLLATVIGLLGALLCLRLLGALARVPLAFVLLGAAAYWLVRSLWRTPRAGDRCGARTGRAGRRAE